MFFSYTAYKSINQPSNYGVTLTWGLMDPDRVIFKTASVSNPSGAEVSGVEPLPKKPAPPRGRTGCQTRP